MVSTAGSMSHFHCCSALCTDLDLVHMSPGGISSIQTSRRLAEVRLAYQRAFGYFWIIPFLMRYVRRLSTFLLWK